VIAAEPPAGTDDTAIAALARHIERLTGIASVSEAEVVRRTSTRPSAPARQWQPLKERAFSPPIVERAHLSDRLPTD
jgi:hypothetical protein